MSIVFNFDLQIKYSNLIADQLFRFCHESNNYLVQMDYPFIRVIVRGDFDYLERLKRELFSTKIWLKHAKRFEKVHPSISFCTVSLF